jgi:hypothetical protein
MVNLHRRMLSALIGVLIALAGSPAAQEGRIKPSSPAVVAPPTWSRVVPMPDGRTFVTDGGLSVDAKVAKPDTLPSTVLPAGSGKVLAGHFAAPYDKETGLSELQVGTFKNSFMTPDGIALNGNYVSFLRRILPPARTRLRTRGKTDPVVVVTDGQAVAIMMPLATTRDRK